MKTTNKLTIITAIALLNCVVAFSSALANAPAIATGVAQGAVKQGTGDVAKGAVGEIADSATENVIGLAKDEANKAVDSGLDKIADSLNPTEKAAEAATEAVKETAK